MAGHIVLGSTRTITDTLPVPADHRLAHAGSVPFEQIAAEPFVLFEEGSGVRALVEERVVGHPALDVRLVLPSNDGLVACVESRIGLAFIPLRCALGWSGGRRPSSTHLDLAGLVDRIMVA